MKLLPQVYDVKTDSIVDVAQDWCDKMFISTNQLAKQRDIARAVLNMKADDAKLREIAKILNKEKENA